MLLLLSAITGLRSANPSDQTNPPKNVAKPTFYRDVLPILQGHCQVCHRAGGIAPMPFENYEETRAYAEAIRTAIANRTMPPWFAVKGIGKFSNDPSLSEAQIAVLEDWAKAGGPAGDPANAPQPHKWSGRWTMAQPDLTVSMAEGVQIPSDGEVDYTYQIVPTNFKEGRWVQGSEILPGMPENVHHAVVYVRPPGSSWLRRAPVGKPFTASMLNTEQDRRDAMWTDSDILLVYAPGSTPDDWPAGMAKYVPAGSDLVFQMHYTTNGHAAEDRSELGMVFSKQPPARRVLTLQLANDHDMIPIPPNTDNYRVEVHGTLPNDCLLLSFFPHMHLRGKRFEYNLVHADHTSETLLRVNYDFYWQLSYRLAEPRVLPAGSELQAIGWYDNSKNNAHNPDPDSPVQWGDQTWNEMMVGFFDVAVPAGMSKEQFFVRRAQP